VAAAVVVTAAAVAEVAGAVINHLEA
jgi:hypothetical protein